MARNGKVRTLDDLATLVKQLKGQGRRIVQAHGVFDLLHIGHIRHLEVARAMGDVLVVTLTRDEHVNKGPHRPAFPQELRAEALAALGVVDYVAINESPQAVEAIRLLRPDVYVKGADYAEASRDITGGIQAEAEAVSAVGGEIRFTDDITFSSSTLLNRHLSPFPPEIDRYLEEFRRRYTADAILAWLDRGAKLRPLVVGEAIIDEYLFGDVIGKSTKDPVLAMLSRSVEAYAGGALAVANHLAGFCDDVRLVTQLGDTDRREEFVRSLLRPSIAPVLLTKSGSPTIHKRRVVEPYSRNKLLEIYTMNDRPTVDEDAHLLHEALEKALLDRDVTIVADYGHGLMTPGAIEILCASQPFLAVNVQANAGNRGFNPLTKYRRADYVCLAHHEVVLETRDPDAPVRDAIVQVTRRIDGPRFTVTLGKRGILHYDRATGFTEAPALATQVLDRVGAGDAVLAVTTLLAQVGAPWDVIAFVGNVAGAELVAELGNRRPLDRVAMTQHITALLK